MKATILTNLVAVGCLTFFCVNSRADLEIGASFSITSESDFYEPLAPQGGWVEVEGVGRCWRPTVAVEWEPYCEGNWVWTDCGWYWDSPEPWAWACYHYGRWYRHPSHHWIWVPGREWAPAWVSWRVGGGYVGWAPLAPARVGITIGAAPFVFVQSSHFHQPIRRSNVIINNTTIINKTTVVNRGVRTEEREIAGVGRRRVNVNEGPGISAVPRATRQTLRPTPVQEVARKTAATAPAEFVRRQAERTGNRPNAAQPRENRVAPSAPNQNPPNPTAPATPPTIKRNPPRVEPSVTTPSEPTPQPRPTKPRDVDRDRRDREPRALEPSPRPRPPSQPVTPPAPPKVERRESPNPPVAKPQAPEKPPTPPPTTRPAPPQPAPQPHIQPAPQRPHAPTQRPAPDYRQPRGKDWDNSRGPRRDKDRPHE